MLSIKLPEDAEKRVAQIAKQAGCDANTFARELILDYLRCRDNMRTEQPASYHFYGMWHDMDLEAQGIDEMVRATRQSRFREILDVD